MKYNVFAPAPELQHIVNQYLVLHSLEDIESLLFLPNGGNFIFFNRGIIGHSHVYNEGEFTLPEGYSISLKTNKVKKGVLHPAFEADKVSFPIILVELLPIGFYKLFHKDATILNDGYMEMDSEISQMYFNNLYQHDNLEEELDYLNQALIALDASHNNIRLCIEDVLDSLIHEHRYEITVQGLVEQFNCSRSTIERQFKKHIGLTPKNFIFVSKFTQTLLTYIEDECTFHDIDYIYSDNSHMNRVFKKILGIVPSEIFKEVVNENLKIYQLTQLTDK